MKYLEWQFKTAAALRVTERAVRNGNLNTWDEIKDFIAEQMPEPMDEGELDEAEVNEG